MAHHAHGTHDTEGTHGDLSAHAGDPETGHHGDHPTVGTYIAVFVALMILLLVAMWLGYAVHGLTGSILGFLVGVLKAVLIILFFMHVKYGTRLTWIFADAPFLWLGIMIVMTMNDFVTRATPASPADPITETRTPVVTTDDARGPVDRP